MRHFVTLPGRDGFLLCVSITSWVISHLFKEPFPHLLLFLSVSSSPYWLFPPQPKSVSTIFKWKWNIYNIHFLLTIKSFWLQSNVYFAELVLLQIFVLIGYSTIIIFFFATSLKLVLPTTESVLLRKCNGYSQNFLSSIFSVAFDMVDHNFLLFSCLLLMFRYLQSPNINIQYIQNLCCFWNFIPQEIML